MNKRRKIMIAYIILFVAIVGIMARREQIKDAQPKTPITEMGIEDGDYLVQVNLEGDVDTNTFVSPASLTVKDGLATVMLEWDSKKYMTMQVGEETYLAKSVGDVSVFVISVERLDEAIEAAMDGKVFTITAVSEGLEKDLRMLKEVLIAFIALLSGALVTRFMTRKKANAMQRKGK